ncbi:MAG: TraR/DksA C4-type zinc finger protein [Paracoccus sp. (in: a-proteobacteria)]|uniref:TraR/DksA C4-type zinc finger protein n=1 Tax=Paracoccus sp. TaxID=267 RepID=UPI0026E0BC1E|nr:TraR/DksA C4-type zinc finger protein [Paracoccus sp. (in: a-proteobacteria)]MDO5631118.1 TraR/DksA C4-type zinc finger protein [Paracoccus sp. (in: a-proteobacteria)]
MDERDLEHADALAEAERANAADRACRAVASPGAADCEDCGAVISAERRAAAPFAIRCIRCQRAHERRRLRHAV